MQIQNLLEEQTPRVSSDSVLTRREESSEIIFLTSGIKRGDLSSLLLISLNFMIVALQRGNTEPEPEPESLLSAELSQRSTDVQKSLPAVWGE